MRMVHPLFYIRSHQLLLGLGGNMGGWTKCNALRRQMQSFAWTVAKLCVGRCNALREIGNVGTEIVSPILDKIKGEKTHHTDC